MADQLSPCITASGLVLWSVGATVPRSVGTRAHALQQEEPPQWEAYVPPTGEQPLLAAAREKPTQHEDPAQPQINKLIEKKETHTKSSGVNKWILCDRRVPNTLSFLYDNNTQPEGETKK